MKELYQCEKCGAIFTNWAEARDHEDHAHAYVPRYGWYNTEAEDYFNEGKKDEERLSEISCVKVWDPVYTPDHSAPVNITVGLEKWVATDKDDDGHDIYQPRIMLYRYYLCKGTEKDGEKTSLKK